jgi:hypothetical protein
MKRVALSLLSISLLLGGGLLVKAQTERARKAIEQIPLEGRATGDFVPRGWVVQSEAEGDLNGDGLADHALTLSLSPEDKEKLNANNSDTYEAPPYIVVVLFAKKEGGFKRFALNGHLYPLADDGPLDLKISKGALTTNQNYHDIDATDVTFRFRYDAASNKMMLIGFELEHYRRANNKEGYKTSDNYLTGESVEMEKAFDRRKKDYVYSVLKRSRIKQVKVSFEDARLKQDDDGNVTGAY